MTNDELGAVQAALREVTAERDRLRNAVKWAEHERDSRAAEVEALKGQCKALRQQLRRERAEHRQTQMALDALRAEIGANKP